MNTNTLTLFRMNASLFKLFTTYLVRSPHAASVDFFCSFKKKIKFISQQGNVDKQLFKFWIEPNSFFTFFIEKLLFNHSSLKLCMHLFSKVFHIHLHRKIKKSAHIHRFYPLITPKTLLNVPHPTNQTNICTRISKRKREKNKVLFKWRTLNKQFRTKHKKKNEQIPS